MRRSCGATLCLAGATRDIIEAMWLEDPSTDELVRVIAIDLLVIQKFRAFDRNTWPMTMQPLLFRTAGLTAIVAGRSEGERRQVMIDLSTAIISIMPPDEHGNADDAAWLRLAAAHARALDVYASESAEEITRHR